MSYPRCKKCPENPVIVTEYRNNAYWPVDGPFVPHVAQTRECGPVKQTFPTCGADIITEPLVFDCHTKRVITQWRCRRCHGWVYFS